MAAAAAAVAVANAFASSTDDGESGGDLPLLSPKASHRSET
jgi:hypothetical protein